MDLDDDELRATRKLYEERNKYQVVKGIINNLVQINEDNKKLENLTNETKKWD